ncbi:thioesterase family protein [Eubacterium oxidoreducens]|uniref:Predicted thioesterase n=1 Tax=Eubacterium oxidoreducens TaxID=1732 RepID=A0A1G6C7W2_EUBOX|nr:thioesterase family protein [Eubacterium oxidoreducens]SDB28996.1 Predicted thioesterase [Eubacterium oxidoreducens]
METGIKGTQELVVSKETSAKAVGSGLLDVFATPSMIALMEKTASESVQSYLEEGQGTVGTKIDISHVAATPLGMKVTCNTQLVEVDRRKLVFKVEAYDQKGLIGEGTHERFIIESEPFQQKADAKNDM